ncbi:alpha/beta hydrolase [Ornatilinea apprima]|nr:alpha/beta hydrolase [Ornatilinea apprima]
MKLKKVLVIALGILLLAVVGFVVWGSTPLGPDDAALAALQSDAQVTVSQMPGVIVFAPVGDFPTKGLVFYPGGRVDYRAYAPTLKEIARGGVLVALPAMPLNLAVFSPNRAQEIIYAYPQIEQWVVGGHSLGGAMAAEFAADRADQVDGLVLWGSYPADQNDLTQSGLHVLSVYGSEDGQVEKIRASSVLLPENAVFLEIEGGNHAQFGSYGTQPGDGAASISAVEQWRRAAEAVLELMESLETQD